MKNKVQRIKDLSASLPLRERRTEILLIVVLLLLVLVLIISPTPTTQTDQNSQSVETPPSRVPDTEILFIGHFYPHISERIDLFKKLGLLDWDLLVFGGDATNQEDSGTSQFVPLDQIYEDVQSISDETVFLRGNHDLNSPFFNQIPQYRSLQVGDIQNIFLDTADNSRLGSSCSYSQEQLQFLKNVLEKESRFRILYSHHAWWTEIEDLSNIHTNNENPECIGDYWEKTVLPIIKDKIDIVIAGDGANFNYKDYQGTRYILNGLPAANPDSTKLLQFTRIAVLDGKLITYRQSLAAPSKIDPKPLSEIPTYRVKVDASELSRIYNSLPVYDISEENWMKKIENKADVDFEIEGSTTFNGETYQSTLSTRGQIGNNWEGLKKSWTLDFSQNPDGGPEGELQLKFILPDDRGYINQLFVYEINTFLGVISPETSIRRLIINGIDFGPYVMYEDFDNIFIEKNRYNSDVASVSNRFMDFFGFYPVSEDLNHLERSENKENKTNQQTIISESTTINDIQDSFEPYIYRRWIASQLFTGDQHQNEGDNMRFFIDRSTGKQIILAWDQYYHPIENKPDPLRISRFQNIVLDDPEEQEKIYNLVRYLLENEDVFDRSLSELEQTYLPVFQNDPFINTTEARLQAYMKKLAKTYHSNNDQLNTLLND